MLFILVSFSFINYISGSYYSGHAPVNYCKREMATSTCKSSVPLFVNRLNSEEVIMPYEYHQFDFCTANTSSYLQENMGQILLGERIRPSPYQIEFMKDESCKQLCTKHYYLGNEKSNHDLSFLRRAISLNYQHHWTVDNMPVTWCYLVENGGQYCNLGFAMGCYTGGDFEEICSIMIGPMAEKEAYYIFNHVELVITYHSGGGEDWGSSFQENGGRIISIKITPMSIKHQSNGEKLTCKATEPMIIPKQLTGPFNITYSYSVIFVKNNTVNWSSRWDSILESIPYKNIFSFNICNSLTYILILSAILIKITLRIFRKEIARQKQMESGIKNEEDEPGWKQIEGDVFRPPRIGMLLSVCVGSGIHIILTALVILAFASLGFLSPANPGSLMTYGLIVYTCLSSSAGYISGRLYKSFGGKMWISNFLLTAMMTPGIVFAIFNEMNFILWAKVNSVTLPFLSLVVLLSLWFVSLLLTFIGSCYGCHQTPIHHPVEPCKIPKEIPKQSIRTHFISGIAMGGILPFSCMYIQFYFILNSIWSSQVFYLFGWLFIAVLLLIITCSETTILLCYLHLRAQDYRWWWRSFLTSGFAAVYFFAYCFKFFNTQLNYEDSSSIILYFGYSLIMAFLFFLMTGSIGFFACYYFIRKIYSIGKNKQEV